MTEQKESIQTGYTLHISKDLVKSSDPKFTMDDLTCGNRYKPVGTFFIKPDATQVWREPKAWEPGISTNTMPRLACQVFEEQLAALSEEEREDFPICQNGQDWPLIRGIYSSKEDYEKAFKEKYKDVYEKQGSTFHSVKYTGGSGRTFFLYN